MKINKKYETYVNEKLFFRSNFYAEENQFLSVTFINGWRLLKE